MVSASRTYMYFKRGWSFIAMPLNAVNFLLISYRLFVEKVDFLHSVFPSLLIYVSIVVPVGFVFAVLLGYWDYRYGTAPQESERLARYSPWHRSVVRSLYLIADGKSGDAKKELKRWM